MIVSGGEIMDWILGMESSIEYIEKHLVNDLSIRDLAEKLYVSRYEYEKMFLLMTDHSVKEYIRNRKLTLAGYELFESEKRIIDVGIKYGYATNESFTRAFTRFHGVTPSKVKKGEQPTRTFPKISVMNNLTGGKIMVNDLSKRGYVVKETGAVYYTMDMEKTIAWFKEVLGWYGQIESKDNDGNGLYGCVNNIPMEIEALHIAPFTGIHLFREAPTARMAGFMLVDSIDGLYKRVKSSGWTKVSEVISEPWGGKTCEVITVDGSILKFFEIV